MPNHNSWEAGSAMDPQAIAERLDTIIALLIPPRQNSANGDPTLADLILEMCDYEHTTEEIAKATKKSVNHVNKELSLLRSRGLVKSVRRGIRLVHVRLLRTM